MLAKGITWYQKDRSSHLKVKEMVILSHQVMSVVNLQRTERCKCQQLVLNF